MRQVLAFYDEHPINERQILAALERDGRDPDRLLPEHLYGHDQDHYGGLAAVDRLFDRLRLGPGQRLLDVCSGMGGPARYLAHERGVTCVGIDLNEGRTTGAGRLTRAVGLADRVAFVCGDATRLPFADAAFDAAKVQEAFLHIDVKPALIRGWARVVGPRGGFAFTDWIGFADLDAEARRRLAQGIVATAIHQVPEYVALLERAGLTDIEVEDLSPEWQEILRQRLEMFRGMEADTVRLFGADRHRAYVTAYEFFVARIGDGHLGGARFSATVP